MPILFGKLELFHEQGMEGNALPVFHDASKMSLNQFGCVEAGYETLVILNDGMHLTIYPNSRIYNWHLKHLAENNVKPSRLFDKEVKLEESYKDISTKENHKFEIRVLHDETFDLDEEHLWECRNRVTQNPFDKNPEIRKVPSRPCHDAKHTSYQEDGPIATFFTSVEDYREHLLEEQKIWFDYSSGIDKEIMKNSPSLDERYDWDIDFQLLPAYQTWNWMFREGFCARLEY